MKSSSLDVRSIRGAAAPKLVLLVVVIAAAAAGGWWFLTQRGASPTAGAPAIADTPLASQEVVAPVISPAVEELSVDQLYREARKAMAEQRLVKPAGNNALEFYLAILEKDASSSGAQEALRELFPFASGTAEQEISQGDLEEANRIIASLAKVDPSNYTLTILRSKLEAKKKLLDQQLAQTAAAATAAAAAARAPTSAPSQPSSAEPPPAAQSSAPAPIAAPAAAPVETRPQVATPAPAAPAGETRDAAVISPATPAYPPLAARNRAEGWVEVEFMVNAEGKVENVRVTRSDPPRVFDREAVKSIEHSTFRARVENGVPVNSTMRRRIEFKLGG
jgi:protein TonB